jgi:hypothetical protein
MLLLYDLVTMGFPNEFCLHFEMPLIDAKYKIYFSLRNGGKSHPSKNNHFFDSFEVYQKV